MIRTMALLSGALIGLAAGVQAQQAESPEWHGSGSKFLFKPKGGDDQTVIVIVTTSHDASGAPILRYYLDRHAGPGGAMSRTTVAVRGTSNPDAVMALFESLGDPSALPRAVFEDAAGVPLGAWLVSDLASLAPYRVGKSTILVPAGYLNCTQYRISRDGRTIDFWVSDRAGPLKLVQLNSTGPRPEQNFELLLVSLISTSH